jgi:hypothetical protein
MAMEAFVRELVRGDAEDLLRVVGSFVPDIDAVYAGLLEEARAAPLVSMLTHNLMDGTGRQVASVGSIAADPEGRVMMKLASDLVPAAPFLRAALAGLQEGQALTPSVILDLAMRSASFGEEDRPLLARGLDAYFAGDFVVAAHIIIPRIEAAIRRLAGVMGATLTKPGGNDAMDQRTLDDLLRDPAIAEATSADFAVYLRALLTDRRSTNARNLVCHGLAPAGFFDQALADRLIHAVLALCAVVPSANDSA